MRIGVRARVRLRVLRACRILTMLDVCSSSAAVPAEPTPRLGPGLGSELGLGLGLGLGSGLGLGLGLGSGLGLGMG